MTNNFKQITVNLTADKSNGNIKISKLLTLLDNHPYKEQVMKSLNIDSILNEIISIKNIDSAFQFIKNANEEFEKINILAQTKDINININYEKDSHFFEFYFDQYRIEDELLEGLSAEGIYDTKNSFFDDNKMSKYANHLFDHGFEDLVSTNVQYFKTLANDKKEYNKTKSYRLLKNNEKYYLRGITSEKYHEYGIDFTFFVTMVHLHLKMKNDKGNNYSISSLSLSESKLDIIIKEDLEIQIPHFGNISLAINISTNELGSGSLNIKSIVRVESKDDKPYVYLLPRNQYNFEKELIINHITGLDKVFEKLIEFDQLFNASKEFVTEIKEIKTIKTPDELRSKIQMKIEQPNSVFKDLVQLKDIFKVKINNEISNFAKLLEMCKKAEELEMEYDMKDKLRYIISDIILYGSAK